MSETIMNEIIEPVEEHEAAVEKPYTFRKLGAPDIFLMATIINKIGLKEFKTCFESDGIKNLIQGAILSESEAENADSNIISVGAGVFLEIASVILGNLPKCEREIYALLSQTSNLTVDEIKANGNAVMFLEMVIDFIKKEEFKDFIKVVSKYLK